ncbi:MAG: hypothetical protein WAW07_10935 [Bacteroidales bacterium]
MKIQELRTAKDEYWTTVSALIDDFELWYKVPSAYAVTQTVDPFVAAALLPAMLNAETIEVGNGLSVSKRLKSNLYHLQEIYHSWNPELKMIEIDSDFTHSNETPVNKGAVSFFSGGVDSMYTFLKQQNDLTHVIYINGFDFFEDESVSEMAISRNSRFVHSFGKKLIPVATNFYHFGYKFRFNRNLSQGSQLGSIAILLSFPRTYIPASFSYSQMYPLGSHPLTDPLWTTESMEVVHDGCEANRAEKILRIRDNKAALSNLRVCFKDMNNNCGECSKCIRTMIVLNLLDIKTDSFPQLPPIKVLRNRVIDGVAERIFLKESIDLVKMQNQTRLIRALKNSYKRQLIKQVTRDLDLIFLNGWLLDFYKRKIIRRSFNKSIDTLPVA